MSEDQAEQSVISAANEAIRRLSAQFEPVYLAMRERAKSSDDEILNVCRTFQNDLERFTVSMRQFIGEYRQMLGKLGDAEYRFHGVKQLNRRATVRLAMNERTIEDMTKEIVEYACKIEDGNDIITGLRSHLSQFLRTE
jgi:hypothetical protein